MKDGPTESIFKSENEDYRAQRRDVLDEGRAEGEDKLAKLMNHLLSNGMTEEAKIAAVDEVARKEMYMKYGIEDV